MIHESLFPDGETARLIEITERSMGRTGSDPVVEVTLLAGPPLDPAWRTSFYRDEAWHDGWEEYILGKNDGMMSAGGEAYASYLEDLLRNLARGSYK